MSAVTIVNVIKKGNYHKTAEEAIQKTHTLISSSDPHLSIASTQVGGVYTFDLNEQLLQIGPE